MQYNETITLKNGKTALLRNGVEADGAAAFENFNQTHAETDYLLSYPDENSFGPQQEGQFLAAKTASENEIEIIAFVEFGRNPAGFRSRLSGEQELVYMLRKL